MRSDMADYPFVRWLERHYAEIRAEAEQLSLDDFLDWPQAGAYEGGWKVFCIFSRDPGWLLAPTCPANALRCPLTSAVLSRIPGVVRGGFSMLMPGTHIFLHEDEHEDSLRCQLALRTNPRAQMRCGQDVLSWEEGRCLLFDGKTRHESANLGATPRLVCLVDVERASLHDEILS